MGTNGNTWKCPAPPPLVKASPVPPQQKQRTSIKEEDFDEDMFLKETFFNLRTLDNKGCLEDAIHVFENMSDSSTFIWNIILKGLTNNEFFKEAIDYYNRMQFEGVKADCFTFPSVIKACTAVFAMVEGQKVYSRIIKLGLDSDIYTCNALILMYAKVGYVKDSDEIFESMPVKDLASWNSMISEYVLASDGWSSLMCFNKM
ncbi:Pentatricopeptide repeat-containing protein [Abeliophyllum distichum]|uniref:Pentatricopeptide repeat-containing protein n=1 Tax=Abeliophyllum distichum TaxID=126358 RepID=A0ABD1RQT8_9LAMI